MPEVNAPSKVDEKAPREVGTSQSIESWLTLWRTQLQIHRDREEERRIGDVRHRHEEVQRVGEVRHRHQQEVRGGGGIRLRRQVCSLRGRPSQVAQDVRRTVKSVTGDPERERVHWPVEVIELQVV